jgi:ribonuclease E
MANKMLIDATHPEETRVVVLRGNRVEEFDFETAHRKQLRGNIYLAKVTRVEPSLQAAFVDYGGNRHGFLAFSEIHPDYYQIPVADRQALIDAEARAAREEEEEEEVTEERPRGGRARPQPEREAARRDDSISGHPVAPAESEPAGERPPAEIAESAPHEPGALSEGWPASESPVASPFEPAAAPAAPVGEAANAPTAGETAAISPYPSSLPAGEEGFAAAPPAESADTPIASTAEHEATSPAPESVTDLGPPNGTEDEEEVVESIGGADAIEEVLDRAPRYRRQYKIQEVIKRRQVMLVQVVKEERGTKGAALTTYLSLAGRYCVLMPNTARGGGISRKITNPEDRKRLREIAEELEVPEGMGVILRTAGANRTKAEVKRDFEYLLRLWEQVRDLTLKSTAPKLVYEEGSLIKRSIRDLYTKDIDEIIVAGEAGYAEAKDFMRMLMPSHAKNVKLYTDTQPIFTRYGIESQLDAMFSPTVQLRSGGYIVINQTEALVAIDVNSGRSTREHHIEDTALKTNIEAAEEIARQLRLRDLAGLIVIDFIDMDEKRNNRMVERRLKDALRNDRARIQVGRISHFGLLEMSRQRIRSSVLESSTEKCPHCGGTGHIRSVSSVALQLLRAVEETLLKGATHNLIVRTRPETALYVLNQKRAHLRTLEERFQVTITVNADPQVGGQIGFAIDRGEQVHTPDQARALLAHAAAPAYEGAGEAETREEEEPAAELEGEAMPSEFAPGEPAMPGEGAREGEAPREGGRRRRRRRGRGRGAETREQPSQPFPREPVALEAGQFGPGTAAAAGVSEAYEPHLGRPLGEYAGEPMPEEPAPSEHLPGEPMPAEEFAPQRAAEGAEAHVNGNGERRRRRRGRRGGRRSRREREGMGLSETAGAPQARAPEQEWREQEWRGTPPQAEPAEAPHLAAAAGEPSFARPVETSAPSPSPLLPSPSAPQPAATAELPAAPERPRRRSTVREPAPILGAAAPLVTSMPTPEPPPSPPPTAPVSAATAEEDTSRPRRTGWWARRLLGGDKG